MAGETGEGGRGGPVDGVNTPLLWGHGATVPVTYDRPMRDGTAKVLSALHRIAYRTTGGRVGRTIPGVNGPMLLLTTTGARTGRKHTVPLLYLDVDGTRVVVASWGGRDYPPDWYANLTVEPNVVVTVEQETYPATARTATPAEKAELWPLALDAYPGYATYQSRTDRDIPLVWLEPQKRSG